MSHYNSDREFSDYVHKNLAMKQIYEQLHWHEKPVDIQKLKLADQNYGIDYVFENSKGKQIFVQERFRDSYYQNYTDCTLRYMRQHNAHEERRLSEFFKIKAHFLVYGITNGSKWERERYKLSHFIKFVVINLPVLFSKIDEGAIILREGSKKSYIENGKMIAPINQNTDYSSSFVAFDIQQLQKLFQADQIIRLQKGFLVL